jgi:methyl-accepting chemotaxis protein
MSAKTPEYLIADGAQRPKVLAKMEEHLSIIKDGLASVEQIETGDADAQAILTRIRDARTAVMASYQRVMDLADEPKSSDQAMKLFQDETSKLFDATLSSVNDLVKYHEGNFEKTHERAQSNYTGARRLIFIMLGTALLLGLLLSVFLARGIVRPLTQAVSVAEAIRSGRLDNAIESGSQDETGHLLDSLAGMQQALRARDEQDADSRGQIAAIGKALAVIEFDVDGRVRAANENFQRVFGYSQEEIRGRDHDLFVEAAEASRADYRGLWQKLARGEYDAGQYKRLGKAGREVWIQASYNPITDVNGKVVKVVQYATDITGQKARNADFEGQLAAISKAQAIIEFNLDGTVRAANDNCATTFGYASAELVGRHHSLLADAARSAGGDERAFWDKLGRGEFDAGQYPRVGKGGREIWVQASYNPIFDANGRPFKVVMYASDVTAQVRMSRALQAAVSETQDAVKRASEGDLTKRVPMDGKSGELEMLCRGINSLLDSTSELVTRVKAATDEVQQGAEEISRGNLNLSQRTEQQASSLEETASSMEQMTSTVKQTADNAGQANELALAARVQAEKGGAVVGNAVAAMSGINDASRKIADIIGVIDEIAFQTNLLALNAAVEAARAGEQGRGFAVVATEVRNLAGRSATAAKEIKALILDSVSKVEQGSKLVDESGQVLGDIVLSVKKVTDIVAEIAAASREQSAGIEQVNKAVMLMDTSTQQNAALVEQAAAASRAIVEQTHALSELVARYRIAEEAREPRARNRAVEDGTAQPRAA